LYEQLNFNIESEENEEIQLLYVCVVLRLSALKTRHVSLFRVIQEPNKLEYIHIMKCYYLDPSGRKTIQHAVGSARGSSAPHTARKRITI
jgi:hypothetical protein